MQMRNSQVMNKLSIEAQLNQCSSLPVELSSEAQVMNKLSIEAQPVLKSAWELSSEAQVMNKHSLEAQLSTNAEVCPCFHIYIYGTCMVYMCIQIQHTHSVHVPIVYYIV